MHIRRVEESDLAQLKEIHDKFYKDEFTFEDFLKNSLGAFLIENNYNIITAVNLRSIIEATMITNKDIDVLYRAEALRKILNHTLIMTGQTGHDSLHAFVQDPNWEKRLKEYGFRDPVGKMLVIG